jgi:opacity protein-like surface antigen
MKKNIPLLFTSLLLFTAADAQAQGGPPEFLPSTAIGRHKSTPQEGFIFAGSLKKAPEPPAEKKRCPDGMNFYAKALGGVNFLQNTTVNGNKTTYKAGYVVSGSLGYRWRHCGLGLEFEYAFRRNDISKIYFVTEGASTHGNFQTSSYMANVLWDLPLCSWGCSFWDIQPFIGAGLGGDFQKMHASNSRIIFNQKWTRLSWQVMTGFSYPIFRNAEISLEYKFHEGGSHFYNHSVGVGFTYKFGFLR